MKVGQVKAFQPITITLETEEEAKIVWDLLRQFPNMENDKEARAFVSKLSDWFSQEAQL